MPAKEPMGHQGVMALQVLSEILGKTEITTIVDGLTVLAELVVWCHGVLMVVRVVMAGTMGVQGMRGQQELLHRAEHPEVQEAVVETDVDRVLDVIVMALLMKGDLVVMEVMVDLAVPVPRVVRG